MLICQRTAGCSKLNGHRSPCSVIVAGKAPMTAPDVRTAAREKANDIFIPLDRPTSVTDQVAVQSFIDGAVWGAAYVTPTRRQLVDVIAVEFHEGDPQSAADAVLAVLQRVSGEND